MVDQRHLKLAVSVGIATMLLNAPILAAEPTGSTDSASTTATTAPTKSDDVKSAPAADAIPDALKDLMPKDSATPTTTSSSSSATSTTTTTGSTSGAAAPNDAKKVSPAVTAITASPSTKPPAQKVQPKPPAPRITLKGRLEEIGGSGARLPMGIMLNLKTQTARMDPSVEKQLTGRVNSFPLDWRGQWGGTLNVWTAQYDPADYQFDAQQAQEEQSILAPGSQGSVSFNFFQQGNVLALQPATIAFAPRHSAAADQRMKEELANSPFGAMLGGNGGAFANMMASIPNSMPALVLGDMHGMMGVTGNSRESNVIKNDLRQLKAGVIEENLVTQESERHRKTGQVRRTYSETVLRFTKLNASQLYVQAASIKYRSDGHFLNKVVMYGTVTRGQGSSMPGIMPGGAFPGLDASGGAGGMDLNNLMKQLQGLQ